MSVKCDIHDKNAVNNVSFNVRAGEIVCIADMIVGYIGGSDRDMDKKKHRGEMCVIDNKKVCLVKVDYLRHTEEIIAETNAAEAAKRLKIAQ